MIQNTEITPRFTGIFIPVEILDLEQLTPLEAILLSWIDALYSHEHGGCYAKNEYLAQRLRVKENTIAKAITNLRQVGLIEDVSFDGRNRVIKSCVGKYIDKCQSKSGLDLNPKQGWTKIQSRVGIKSNRTYIESKEERKEYSKTKTADAEEKKKPSESEILEPTKTLYNQLIEVLQKRKPDYIPPKSSKKSLEALQEMLTIQKRDSKRILKIFSWAVNNIFWVKFMFGKNFISVLKESFDTIEIQSLERSKERKFAPSSDDDLAFELLQKMKKDSI